MGQTFQRVEKKYLISKDTYIKLLQKIDNKIKPDQYGLSTICNIYYDTSHYDLIRKSIDKPIYKEKLRLRSYGIPKINDKVFLEIKKKYKNVVNKRRICLSLKDFYNYLDDITSIPETQIKKEIDYFFKFYNVEAMLFLAYDRLAFVGIDDSSLRITFDTNIRSRNYDLNLEKGDYGDLLYDQEYYLMEIKVNSAYPIWLVKILNELKIYPTSFSKYGKVYSKQINRKEINYV